MVAPQRQQEHFSPQREMLDSLRPASRACPSRCLTPFVGVERSAKPKGANGSNNQHCASRRQRRESSASDDAGRVNLNDEERPAIESFKEGETFPRSDRSGNPPEK